jgi:hypothetical protein
MSARLLKARRVVVGATLLFAAVVVLVASEDPSWPVPGVSTLAVLAGVFAVGFLIAAGLHELAGERGRGVGNLLAVCGWLLLLVGELLDEGLVVTLGVAVVLAAGTYLLWLGFD